MKDKFVPQKDTSYSAGLAYLITQPVPELILVLQRGGERNQQKQGPDFVERRAWKIPMGHFDPAKDFNLVDTATREFQEETGLEINLNETSIQGDMSRRIPSERPGYSFHEDRFFLMSAASYPEEVGKKRDANIEKVTAFALTTLPVSTLADDACLAPGHRKKLAALFVNCRSYLKELDVDVDALIAQLAA